jgi:anti-sigma-K factor RskA
VTDQPRQPAGGLTCDEVRDLAASFVLGALEADAADAVRAHLATCPSAHAEVVELAAVLPVLAESVPQVEPPAGLKGRIMAAAGADLARGQVGSTAAAPVPVELVPGGAVEPTGPVAPTPTALPTAEPTPIGRPAGAASSPRSWVLGIAAVLAIALLGGWNLLLQGQLSAAQQYEDSVAAVLEVAAQPGSLTAVLTSEGGDGPAGLAAVSAAGAVTLAMQELDPTSGDEVYEAWVIGGDGVPVPLGSFAVGASGVASFQADGLPTDPGIVLALTLEPGPDATTPTLPIVSSGTATAG